MKSSSSLWISVFLLLGIVLLNLQVNSQTSNDPAASGATNSSYTFPNSEKRFKRFVNEVAGPEAFVGSGIGATFQQIGNNPPEWKRTAAGFGRRFASNLGQNAIEQATLYGLSEAFRQDYGYRKCDCKKPLPRMGHALFSGFTAYDRRGKKVVSPGKIVSPFVSNVAAVELWYPERYSVKDGLRQGAYSLGFNVGFNLIREFIFKK